MEDTEIQNIAGMRWQDRKSSSKVAEMCGVEDFSVELRQRKPRLFGQVKRAEGCVLGKVELWDNSRWESLDSKKLSSSHMH